MLTVYFKGQVLPAFHSVTLGERKIKWEATDIGLTMDFTVNIVASVIDIRCDVNRFVDTDLVPLYMRAVDLSRASVNMTAFASGFGMTVVLHTFVKPDGTFTLLAITNPDLVPLCTAFAINSADQNVNLAFDDVYRLVITEPALFMALDDLIVSITLPHHAPINCARALDGIRNMIAPGLTTKQSWEMLRDNLNLSKDYLKLITDTSVAPRHGDRTHIPGPVIMEISKRSWIIMDRLLHFRKRGNQPLPIGDFPELS